MEVPAETNPTGPNAPMNQSSGALWASYPIPRVLILIITQPPLFLRVGLCVLFSTWDDDIAERVNSKVKTSFASCRVLYGVLRTPYVHRV